MRVLVACEYSGRVRDAFRALGHDAWSCDLLPCDADPRWHLQRDALEVAYGSRWDLMIAHPPCTHLAVSGARHFAAKRADGRQQAALDFVRALMAAPIARWCIENPVGVISTAIRRPDQIIQPWQFGHPETKTTCLWLQGLPPLEPTAIVEPDFMRNPDGTFKLDRKGRRYSRIHWLSGRSADRSKIRSLTYQGWADAMAAQWGGRASSRASRRASIDGRLPSAQPASSCSRAA